MRATKRQFAIHIIVLCFFLARSAGAIANPTGQTAKAADYSKEPYVIEQALTKIVVQNDGTHSADTTVRMRIQSQAGLKQFGMLAFSYAASSSSLDIIYVRVVKPDKRVVVTPAENVLDMPAEITREAPFYSDLKQKQVAVKGLEVGDFLEYQYTSTLKNPLAAGQFWISFSFVNTGICLDEDWQVSIPRGRYVKVESPKLPPTISEQGVFTVYAWKSSHLEGVAEDKNSKTDEPDEPTHQSVQITSYRDWNEVGQWIRGLVAPRVVPTPPIKAKADELTRDAKTDSEKIKILYNFVSNNFRYIGISLGIGRYQPHAAEDVLSNDYGDCKDKHTLFAALLAAENIKAFPALVSSASEIDTGVPDPSQFDHMITAIPQADGYLFLDATPDVAPFGFLVEAVRDKEALVVPDTGPAKLVKTPFDPPFKSFLHFQADGALSDEGTFESKMQLSIRGDSELVYRQAFRNAGQPQWPEVMQKVSGLLGFGGTVSDVTISAPDSTDAPFHIEYNYLKKEYGDWANRQFICPAPPIYLPVAPDADKKAKPIKLGTSVEMFYTGTMKLPSDSNLEAPATVDLHEDFADYHSSYTVSNGTLHFNRRLITKASEVPASQIEAYRKFIKAIVDDTTTFISLDGRSATLPEFAGSPEAQRFFQQGSDAWSRRDMPAAADAFQKAVKSDPKFAEAWLWLGCAHAYSGNLDQGIEEMKKALAIDPTQLANYKLLASTLRDFNRENEAYLVWRQLEKQSPTDKDAARNIVSILMQQKRYSDALPELKAAVESYPEDAGLLEQLGDLYFHLGDKDKAVASFEGAVEKAPNRITWNDAAYTFAENNTHLDVALQYSQNAVNDVSDETTHIDLEKLNVMNLRSIPNLDANWDTLGWIHFRLGHLDQAQKYLNAAWVLGQDKIVADHLQQVYEKMGKKITLLSDKATLQSARTVSVKQVSEKHATAEFFVLFAPGPKIVGVKFISGSEELRGADKVLAATKFDVPFPDDHPAQILRRGVLDCEPELDHCVFVLISPYDVRSAN